MGIENVLPNGHVLTDEELERLKEEAKDWTRMMLERACIPASHHARKAIVEAIEAIVAIYVRYGVYDGGHLRLNYQGILERDAVLADLIDKLFDLVEDYAQASSEDDDEWIAALIAAPFFGMTTMQRLKSRVERLKKHLRVEIEMDAKDNGGVIGTGVDPEAVIGIAGITDLVRNEIGRVWQRERARQHADAQFVHVYRGSSYDCPECDAEVAKGWQPIDIAELPPFHTHCVCWTAFA